jgi:hypothetical protein
MRIIYNKKTKEIVGVIKDLVTSHLPPTSLGDTEYKDFDNKKLDDDLLRKRFIKTKKGFKIKEFKRPTKPTVLLDIRNPKFDKDVEIYVKKAKEKGAKVIISENRKMTMVYIKTDNVEVGRMMFLKKGCCEYVYKNGIVFNRNYYPHYLGLYSFWEYLKDKRKKYVDLGGMSKDEGLNRFKKKWGEVVDVEY